MLAEGLEHALENSGKNKEREIAREDRIDGDQAAEQPGEGAENEARLAADPPHEQRGRHRRQRRADDEGRDRQRRPALGRRDLDADQSGRRKHDHGR